MNTRAFERQRIWRLTSTELAEATRLLAHAVTARFGKVDAVIGISRGGTEPAAQIASLLHAPAATVAARHNPSDELYLHSTGNVDVDLDDTVLPAGRRYLVVDDIVGSGATLQAVCHALRTRVRDARIHTVTLCRNTGSVTIPDLWVWNVSDWVVFPWESKHSSLPATPLPHPTGTTSS